MKRLLSLLLILLLSLADKGEVSSQSVQKEPKTLDIGAKAPDFNLPGIDGKRYTLKNFEKAPVLVTVFNCNNCPTAQAYEDSIISIEKDYKKKGVAMVMISPNSITALDYSELGYTDLGDSLEEIKQRAAVKGFITGDTPSSLLQ